MAAAYGDPNGHGHNHDVYNHSHDEDDSMLGEEPLFGQIDVDSITCLNEAEDGMGKNPFKVYDKRTTEDPYLESDADEQLLLHIPFTEACTIKSICFVGHHGGMAPRNVKIWVNKQAHDIDFDTAEDATPTQEMKQIHEDFDGSCYYFTRRGQFNSVSSLTIFVQDNYGADTTRINFIGFKGEFGKGKRRAVHTIYEVTPDALDKKVDEQAHELMQSNTNQT